jgi:hypothetical protein
MVYQIIVGIVTTNLGELMLLDIGRDRTKKGREYIRENIVKSSIIWI